MEDMTSETLGLIELLQAMGILAVIATFGYGIYRIVRWALKRN